MTLLSRRAILAGVAAAAIARPAQASDFDVAVVGAGAAGIAAGRELIRNGKKTVILEAASRAGGRLHTDRTLGPHFDAGGAYIHNSEVNPWSDIATENGIDPLGGYRLWSGSIAYRNGAALTAEETGRRWTAIRSVSGFYDEVEERYDLSMAQALRAADAEVQDAARIQAQMAAGEDPEFVSVADWQRLESGGNRLVPGGFGSLAEKAAQPLPIRYSTAVTVIAQDAQGVTLSTSAGDIKAKKVIVTVSVGVLKADRIRFTPNLPLDHARALDGLKMGALSKVALRFESERFGFQPHQFLADVTDPRRAVTFEAWPQDTDLILGVFGGEHARGIVRAGEAAAVDAMLSRVVAILGSDARKHFKGGRLAGWSANPLTEGSYAVVLPGRLRSRDQLARPIADRIWITGEATAGIYAMTAGGAYIAGREAARQVAARLGRS
jgi:monoamine oxidase